MFAMARSKAKVYCCCALILLCLVAIIVCIAVAVRRKCPDDTFSRAAVAADSQKCSEIGRDILKQGGSAVDGAIAALLCTSVMNPQSMGVGGGSIFTVMSSSGEVKIINSREIAPQKINPDFLKTCHAGIQMTPGCTLSQSFLGHVVISRRSDDCDGYLTEESCIHYGGPNSYSLVSGNKP